MPASRSQSRAKVATAWLSACRFRSCGVVCRLRSALTVLIASPVSSASRIAGICFSTDSTSRHHGSRRGSGGDELEPGRVDAVWTIESGDVSRQQKVEELDIFGVELACVQAGEGPQ